MTSPIDTTLVERVGLAIEAAWNCGDSIASGLPPIELSPSERDLLARAALDASGKDEREDLGECELCSKPLALGQFVNQYDDIGAAHANCEAPFARPTELTPAPSDDGSTMPTYVLLGVPALLADTFNNGELIAALREARRIVKSDADACRAFAAPNEKSEPERVLNVIDAAIARTQERS